jgi:hypothetical protein
MYPDLARWPEETLVLFRNEGDWTFTPEYLEKEPSGKWLLMDAADVDGDGDQDLILGANLLIRGVLVPPRYTEKWNKEKIAYRVFVNETIKDAAGKTF